MSRIGELRKHFLVFFGVNFVGLRKALAVGESLAIVHHHRGEPGEHSHLGDAFRNVAGAEDEDAGLRNHGLDKHAELSSADEAVVVRCILAETEVHLARSLGFHHFARGVPNFGFHASAAHGADHGAILAHQQFSAFVTRNGAVHLDDGGEGALLAQATQPDHLLVNVHSSELYRGARLEDWGLGVGGWGPGTFRYECASSPIPSP